MFLAQLENQFWAKTWPPGMLSLGFVLHSFNTFPGHAAKTLGRHYFTHLPVLQQNMFKNKFRNGAQKKVYESACSVGVLGQVLAQT